MTQDFQADIDAIGRVDAVPTILDVVCATTGMGFAAVARVTPERWIACGVKDNIAFGLKPGSELKVETTICHEIRHTGEPVIIDNVSESKSYRNHHTPLQYGFQSYISVPIILRDGSFFGTLCAIDPKPARLDKPQILGMFKLFSDLIAFHLDANRRVEDARETSDLREQFIAVLGHDLRNPLASIAAGIRLQEKEVVSPKGKSLSQMMQASVDRMAALIDNVLDFARGRLGGGLILDRKDADLTASLNQVLNEIRVTAPDRVIEARFELTEPVNCDSGRVAQLLSNLIGNALRHGDSAGPVIVEADTKDGVFELSVANTGDEIPADIIPGLFQPFVRGGDGTEKQGLGLGLYIASEIAQAHGGTMTVTSSPAETRFTFRMPLA